MAGQVKVAVVSGAISSSGIGTADFTKPGFGTPKACIVLLSFDAVDDTGVSAEGKASIGFSDFTNHRCITHQDENGSAKVDSDDRKSATKAYVLLDIAAVVDIDGTASTIAEGVRLTNTTNVSASAVFATIIMFGGADLQVSLDSVTLGNGTDLTTVVTTGIPQDLVFFIGADISGEDSSSSGINNSFGVADISNDQATIVNRCMGWASDHNNNVGSPACIVRNDRCLKVLTEAAGDDWGVELTAATATSYTVTTRDISPRAGMEVYALALDVDDRGSKIGSVDSPTAGATWTPAVALGFMPQYVGLGLTHAQVEGTIEADEDTGGLGISSNTGTGEETFHGWYNEDASAAANTNNNFRSRVIDFRNDDVTVLVHDHSHSSFNNGNWTYTINTENEITARKWFYWAIEELSAGVDELGEATAIGVAVSTAVGAADHKAIGTAVGVAVSTAVGAADHEAIGTAIGICVSTAVGDITIQGAATAVGVAVSTAVGVADHEAIGTALSVSISTAAGAVDHPAISTAVGDITIQGAATAVGVAVSTAVGVADHEAIGTALSVSISTAAGAVDHPAISTAVGVVVSTAVGVADHEAISTGVGVCLSTAVGFVLLGGGGGGEDELGVATAIGICVSTAVSATDYRGSASCVGVATSTAAGAADHKAIAGPIGVSLVIAGAILNDEFEGDVGDRAFVASEKGDVFVAPERTGTQISEVE